MVAAHMERAIACDVVYCVVLCGQVSVDKMEN
jgi:hypothetical protein